MVMTRGNLGRRLARLEAQAYFLRGRKILTATRQGKLWTTR